MRVKSKGAVYLVGAGPGDVCLLTLRGAELLRRADVVLYDALVNPDLLRLAPPSAELVARGKNMSMPQDEIVALLIARAREGKCVVRLKGGDPYVFGRGGEEAEALAVAKIPFEVVPGVSSVIAAPNYAGIPLTHREYCSSFTVFTGHENPADAKTDLRYEQIAQIPGTKVVLMGTDRLDDWTKSLIAHGMSPDTPAAMVRWGTMGRQKSVAGTLATIAALAAGEKISPPVLTIIGDVVKLRGKLNWFEQRPLFGQRIVVTRRPEQAGSFAHRLAELGADPAASALLPVRVGQAVASRLLLTGAALSAEEAARCGLVARCADNLDAALDAWLESDFLPVLHLRCKNRPTDSLAGPCAAPWTRTFRK